MLRRVAQTFFRGTTRAFYSTQQKVNVVVVPKVHDIPFNTFAVLDDAIDTAPTCKTLSVLIKENLELFSDHHIGAVFNQIGRYDLVVDDYFHTVIAPIAVEWVKTFTRSNARALQSILLTLLYRDISSPELEQLVVKKLDEESIYRYLDYKGTVAVFLAMAKHKRFHSSSLFNKIQKVIYQQKKYYSNHPDMLKAIKEGMEMVEQIGDQPLQIQQAYKQIA